VSRAAGLPRHELRCARPVWWGTAVNRLAMPTIPPSQPATRNPKPPAGTPGGIGEFREEARRVCRLRHLSIPTEESYVQTIRRFIHFHDQKHPARLGMPVVRAYLSRLKARPAAAPRSAARHAAGSAPRPASAAPPCQAHHRSFGSKPVCFAMRADHGSGQGRNAGRSASYPWASIITPASSKRCPTICNPMGRPSAS
jgi:hypothetical protein